MYYPFLRARQFELIALRDLAKEGLTQDFILPILEPVKGSSNNLKLANKVFHETDQKAYLILNPLVGELKNKTKDLLEFYKNLEENSFVPAFHYRNNFEFIHTQITSLDLSNCLIICEAETSSDDEHLLKLLSLDQITAISVEKPEGNRSLKRLVFELGKQSIRFDDFFIKQQRNSDYLSILSHRFTEEHIYYEQDGYYGFSDYTVLSSEFSTGGSTPRAVAIHLTYLKGNSQIWIRHFTSVTNDSISNVQGKFAEASKKAVEYCRSEGLSNQAIKELEKYYDEQHYPGLGTVKKISIKNHLLVIRDYLLSKRT